MDIRQLMLDFKLSVHKLADSLPQWSSNCQERRKAAAVASLFEECGEICGLISKYETRKVKGTDLWGADFTTLPEELKLDIIKKFSDELGDLLWVLTAASHCLTQDEADIYTILDILDSEYADITDFRGLSHRCMFNDSDTKYTSELCINILAEIMNDIYSILRDCNIPDNNALVDMFETTMMDICALITYLKLKYNIHIEDVLLLNMEKLGIRYDANGNRVDGKL